MRITGLRCEALSGTLARTRAEFYRSWFAQPVDVYGAFDEHTGEDDVAEDDDEPMAIEQVFLSVETSSGERGLVGPLYGGRTLATLILDLEDLLVGRDPLETEKAWDLLYRDQVHGRKGKTMHAISAVDCALWDLKGKHYGEPVHRLLGGPTRAEIPAYAAMLAFSTDPEDVEETAAAFADRGYDGQKWFFQHGPRSGKAGQRENEALARAAREGAGEDYDLMFDAWMSWDLTYAREMIDRLEPYDPRWLEEPLQPDLIDGYAALRAEAPFPIAGGEHEYTRWGADELLSRDAVDVLQPDVMWAGGISELVKIAALASVDGVPLIPHGWSVLVTRHVAAALAPGVCPILEHPVKAQRRIQHLLVEDVEPEDGALPLPEAPGLGITIDDGAVTKREELGGA